jgi:hypothetical protein
MRRRGANENARQCPHSEVASETAISVGPREYHLGDPLLWQDDIATEPFEDFDRLASSGGDGLRHFRLR